MKRIGVVADAGGGEVRVLVDRELDYYPTVGTEVLVNTRPDEVARPARRASPIDCKHGDWYRDTRDFTWCMDCGRWRDDVMAEVALRP